MAWRSYRWIKQLKILSCLPMLFCINNDNNVCIGCMREIAVRLIHKDLIEKCNENRNSGQF